MNLFSTSKKICQLLLLAASLACLQFCTGNLTEKKINIRYPNLKSISASDTYFGQIVIDKYRIIENTSDKTVQQWIKEEKNLCDSLLQKISYRDTIQRQLEDIIYSSNVRGGFPRVIDKKLFFLRIYTKEKVQKLFYRDSLSSKEVELFSTETINNDSKVFNIDYYEPSFDGKYLAFGLSSNGDEMTVIKIIDVGKKILLPDSIERTPYGTPFWIPGKNAFFYGQLKSDADLSARYEDAKVKLHWLGTDSKTDKEVFSRSLNKNLMLDKIDVPIIYTFPTSDKVLAFTVHGATTYLSLYFASLNDLTGQAADKNGIWKNVCNSEEKTTGFALNGNQLFILSYKDNPNGSFKKYDLNKGLSTAVTLLEGKEEVLEEIIQTKNSIYIKKLKNGISSIVRMDMVSNTMSDIQLPFNGYLYLRPAFGVSPAYLNSNDLFFSMESWNKEIGIYNYNPDLKQTIKTDLRTEGKYGSPDDIVIKEVEVPSHDGILVPLSIIYAKDIKLDGENPTLLEGYGAYGVSMNAGFEHSLLAWLRMGGIYAVAHVRGGGEKGDSWYKGGYKSTKSNSWKDFITCAEYLIKNQYSSPVKLAAKGVSAGGITVGRAITERPDLFKAAILDVSVLNSLRFEKTSNTINVSEYGTATDSSEFNYLFDMDVYHHIKDGIKYPSLLITTGLNDARVDLWQPAKAVARFQEVSAGKDNVVLFKISDEGHSGSADKVKDATDEYSFLFWQLHHPKFKLN